MISAVPCNGTFNRNTGYTACPGSSGATGYRYTLLSEQYTGGAALANVQYKDGEDLVGTGINPTLAISGADQQEVLITITDLNGRAVASYTLFAEGDVYISELTNFPDLVAGMYLMHVQVGDNVQSHKFIAE